MQLEKEGILDFYSSSFILKAMCNIYIPTYLEKIKIFFEKEILHTKLSTFANSLEKFISSQNKKTSSNLITFEKDSKFKNVLEQMGFGNNDYCTIESLEYILQSIKSIFQYSDEITLPYQSLYYKLTSNNMLLNNINFLRKSTVTSNGKYYTSIETEETEQIEENKCGKRIIAIGDSKFMDSLYINSDSSPIKIMCQLFKERGIDLYVENHNLSGNCLYNVLATLKSISLDKGDIVIISVMIIDKTNGFYWTMDKNDPELVKVILKEIKDLCVDKELKLIFVDLPKLNQFSDFTYLECLVYYLHLLEKFELSTLYSGFSKDLKNFCLANSICLIDFKEDQFEKMYRASFFIDSIHLSSEGSECIGSKLFTTLRYIIEDDMKDKNVYKQYDILKNKFQQLLVKDFESDELLEYLDQLRLIAKDKPENSGAIIVNCNPFTFGHRYLIEKARKQVDYLYILVVEEDLSYFKFKDRFEMVKRGVKDIEGVEIINSGKFIISASTFPDYFIKDSKQTEEVDPTLDVEIFCKKIAPALKIKKRFVGEEPLDRVTNIYNEKMKKILPNNGLDLIVIPRKTNYKKSRVRKEKIIE